MKYFISIFMVMFSVVVMAADAFIPGTEDVPLMSGLAIQADEEVSFDTPAGQILVVQASSNGLTQKQVVDFYKDALAALGWTAQKELEFERADQKLTLSFVRSSRPLVVQFELEPAE